MRWHTDLVYLFIRHYMEESNGRPPTLVEIGEAVDPIKPLSKSVVWRHLTLLEERGCIERVQIGDTKKHIIRLPGAHFEAPPIPDFVRSI